MESDQIYRNAVYDAEKIPHLAPDTLSDPQKKAVEQILAEWQKPAPRPVLLHGVTGSGKTQVYMELIDQVIRQGRGHCADSGDCPYLSDCKTFLRAIW